jgi:hypothetical protein
LYGEPAGCISLAFCNSVPAHAEMVTAAKAMTLNFQKPFMAFSSIAPIQKKTIRRPAQRSVNRIKTQ